MFYSCFLNDVLVTYIMTISSDDEPILLVKLSKLFFFSDYLDCVMSPESFTEGEGKHLFILYFLEGDNLL